MWALALAAVLGVAAGVLAGLFGVGGGILFVPTLTLVLGLTQLHAEATSLLAILPTSIAGVAGGGFLAEALPQHALRRLFAVLLLVVAAQLAWRARHN